MYQSGMTIKEALDSVSKNLYVLPAIQRGFVWKPEQICRLFDSLMQGYPFGTFLFWKVEPEKSAQFKFYGFVQNFHERDAPQGQELGTLPNRELTAVLDGQQRLTALNVGLRGSMAVKLPRMRRNSPAAFPKKTLHLNLLADQGDDEEGEKYSFEFLEPSKAGAVPGALMYQVADILAVTNTAQLAKWLHAKVKASSLPDDGELFDRASDALFRLYEVVHSAPILTYYTEKSQELERVLRIFIRTNSGGTVLSYSDLLLSIAVAQWSKLDAREEIRGLLTEVNQLGRGFNVSKDFVLKAGLILADKSFGFKVENFTRPNMEALEKAWPDISQACVRAVGLAASFGFSEQTLRAESALLPIAYYIFKRTPPENWLTHANHKVDRNAIRDWLIRSVIKPSGIWGSGLDTLLAAIREVIRVNHATFPTKEIDQLVAARGKSLAFGPEEIDELLDMEYGDRRLFPLLSILYPLIDVKQLHHIDHFYPKSRLQRKQLEKAGCTDSEIEECLEARDCLANLHLLEGPENQSKKDKLPAVWLAELYPDSDHQAAYLQRHDLADPPAEPSGFLKFYNQRRAKLKHRLTALLSRTSESEEGAAK
jgi:hypothetical protein